MENSIDNQTLTNIAIVDYKAVVDIVVVAVTVVMNNSTMVMDCNFDDCTVI